MKHLSLQGSGRCLVAFLMFLQIPIFGQGIVVFAPSEAENNLNGNSSIAPFATSAAGRFQQLYSSSSFSSLMPAGGGWIDSLCFRVDATVGFTFDVTIQNVQLDLSTTLRSPDGLSPVFSENVGADKQTLFGPTSMRLRGTGGGGVTGFNVCFDFRNNPFFYNPSNGNLLMDFQIFSGAGNPPSGGSPLDAFDVSGDSVSSVFAYGGSLPVTGQASSLGLASAFGITPVPEPCTWVLLIAGILVFALPGKRKLKPKPYVPHRCHTA